MDDPRQIIEKRVHEWGVSMSALSTDMGRMFTEASAAAFATLHGGAGRPYRVKGQSVEAAPLPRPGPRERRPVTINDRLVLLLVLLDQPGETVTRLAQDAGLAANSVRNWARGRAVPDDHNTGRLVAYARGRYALRVGAALDELGKAHRARYMENYMRARRA